MVKKDENVLGSKDREERMDKAIDDFAKRFMALAGRVYCAKKARERLAAEKMANADTTVRKGAYEDEIDKLKARLNIPPESRWDEDTLRELKVTIEELGGLDIGLDNLADKVTAESEVAPFAYLISYRTGYGDSKDPALKGWNRDELAGIFGPQPENIFRIFSAIKNGQHGKYWQERLEKTLEPTLVKRGNRYSDEIFNLYFEFRLYLYLKTLKEVAPCCKTADGKTELSEDEIASLKKVVDLFNKKAAAKGMPTVNCWDDVFNRSDREQPERG